MADNDDLTAEFARRLEDEFSMPDEYLDYTTKRQVIHASVRLFAELAAQAPATPDTPDTGRRQWNPGDPLYPYEPDYKVCVGTDGTSGCGTEWSAPGSDTCPECGGTIAAQAPAASGQPAFHEGDVVRSKHTGAVMTVHPPLSLWEPFYYELVLPADSRARHVGHRGPIDQCTLCRPATSEQPHVWHQVEDTIEQAARTLNPGAFANDRSNVHVEAAQHAARQHAQNLANAGLLADGTDRRRIEKVLALHPIRYLDKWGNKTTDPSQAAQWQCPLDREYGYGGAGVCTTLAALTDTTEEP